MRKIMKIRGELCVVERVVAMLEKEVESARYAINYYYKKNTAIELTMKSSFSCTRFIFPYYVEILYEIENPNSKYAFYKGEQEDIFHQYNKSLGLDKQDVSFDDRFLEDFYEPAEVLKCF